MTEPERNARESDRDDSQGNRAAEPWSHENGNQYKTRGRKQDLRIGNPSKPDLRSGISHDHLCVAQADKRDKQADAGGCSVLEAIRYGVDDLLANVAQRKQDSREKYYSERCLPWHAAAKNNGIGEVSVQRHSRSEGNQVIRPESITSVATAEEMQVANSTPSTGIPLSARICGFTITT